jgi:hypothetical protein
MIGWRVHNDYKVNDNKLILTMCHCERSPAPHGVQGEVKQSQEIATLARRSASAHRHVTLLLAMTTFQGRSL